MSEEGLAMRESKPDPPEGVLRPDNRYQSGGLVLRRYRHVALIICVALVLTVIFFYVVRRQEQDRTQSEFERQANAYVAAIQKGIERNLEVLESIGGLFAASAVVERQDFRAFVNGPLSRHQEIQALSWNQRVRDSDRASYEAAIQNGGFPSFQITERKDQGQMQRAERRAEYISVTYIEPLKGNEAAVGFDVASNPTRLKALERSRETGEMVATARITLVQETEEQFGVLILKPVYKSGTPHETVEHRRQNLTGFAVGVFRIGDMVEVSLKDLPKGSVNIQLYDETSAAGERFLYLHRESAEGDSPTDEEHMEARNGIYTRAALDIPGRQWTLLISPTSEFLASHDTWKAWGVLGGGLLITALLVAYLLSMINRATRIEGLVAELSGSNEELESEITERKKAEGALRESEDWYRELYEDAPIAYFATGVNGRLQKANRRGAELLGYTRDELIGRPVFDLYADTPAGKGRVQELFRRFLAGEGWRDEELEMRRADGTSVWISLTSQPVRTAEGQLESRSMVLDITERKQAEQALRESEERYRSLYQNTPVMMHSIDPDGRLVSVNDHWVNTLGYERSEVIGRRSIEFLTEVSRNYATQVAFPEFFKAGGVAKEVKYQFVKKSGEVLDMLLSGVAERNESGEIIRVSGFMVDITDRKRAEQAFREAAERIEQQSRELLRANARLTKADQAKSDFLSYMSHELRTPLNAALGFAQLLSDPAFGELGAKQRHFLDNIVASGNLLLQLINDIIDLSRIDAGKLELDVSEVDARECLSSCYTIAAGIASEKGVTLTIEKPPEGTIIRGDERRIKQIIFNLLSNAIKFTPEGGTVSLRGFRKGDELYILVKDTGVGIDQQDHEKIFEMFEQGGPEVNRRYGGSGLGLPLVKQLVELHGGRVWVRSVKGRGSTFTVALPLYPNGPSAEGWIGFRGRL